MMENQVCKRIKDEGFIAIARNIPQRLIGGVAKALLAGGLSFLEITFCQDQPDALERTREAIDEAVRAGAGKMCVGAGTVLTAEQARTAYEAGAQYIISPSFNPEVVRETKRFGMVSIPGAFTPTEIVTAWEAGADIVKLFPADDLGCHYIRNIRVPLGHIPLFCTGGVNLETIPGFFAAGAAAVGGGVTVLRPDCIAEERFDEITRLAALHVEAVRNSRKGVNV